MRRRRFLLALAATAAFAGCGRCGRTPPPVKTGPQPVAVVDGEPISPAALRRELASATLGADGGGVEADRELRRRLLDDLVSRVLLLQQARRRSVAAPPEEVERAVTALRAEYTGPQFEALLAEQRLTEPELRARVAEQLTIERLFRQEAFTGVAVTEPEIAQYYAEHGPEFDQPAQVNARQVVVRTREEAQRIRAELHRRPAAFAEVARRVSLGPEAASGGDLGWFGKGSGMPEVFDRCLDLPVKTISEPIPSPYGYHLFQVTARRPAQRRPLDEVRPAIRERLLQARRARAQQDYLAGLKARARIEVDDPALADLKL